MCVRIVEHEKSRRVSVDGSTDGGRTPRVTPSTSNAELPATLSLRNTATESSALLRAPGIVEHPNGLTEREYDAQSIRSYASQSGGGGSENGSTYGAVQSSSPPNY